MKPEPILPVLSGTLSISTVEDELVAADQQPQDRFIRWMGVRLVVLVALAVFSVETAIMLLLNRHNLAGALAEGLVDAALVTLITAPVVYVALARPLMRHMHAIRRAEAQHNLQVAALEAAAHGVVITDRQGKIRYTNPAFNGMTGYSAAEMLGHTPNLLNSGQHDTAFFRAMWQQILSGQVWTGEIINRRKDGTLYTEEQTITPVRNQTGSITHFVAVKHDTTARRAAAEQLAQRNQELLALSRAEHRQRHLAEALVAATAAINGSLDLTRVLDLILEQTQSLVPCRTAGVLLLRGDWIDVARLKHNGGAPTLAAHPLANGFPIERFPRLVAARAARELTVRHDTSSDADWEPIAGIEWLRSLLVAPLTDAGEVVGFLVTLSDQPDYFGPDALHSLKALAGQAMVGLQNARLFSNALAARHTAETLSAASVALTQTLDADLIATTLLRYIQQLAPYTGAYVALKDGESLLHVRAVAGYGPDLPPPVATGQLLDPVECRPLGDLLKKQTLVIGRVDDKKRHTCLVSKHGSTYLAVPLVAGNHSLGLCVLEAGEPGGFGEKQRVAVEALAALGAVATHNALLYEQVREGHARQQSLAHRLVEVQETERRLVARELHDEAGQALTSLILELGRLERELTGIDGYGQRAASLRQLADDVWENLHRLAMDLRPATLDHLGLVEALASYIARVDQQNGLRVHFKASGLEQQRLAPDLETALYRIAQEALTNVSRHAHAARADVLLQRSNGRVTLIVEDNGCGFAQEEIGDSQRLGLLGMRERCEMLGGRLVVESSPGAGTTVVGEIPCGDSDSRSR